MQNEHEKLLSIIDSSLIVKPKIFVFDGNKAWEIAPIPDPVELEPGDYSITAPTRMFWSDVYDPENKDVLFLLPLWIPRHGEIVFSIEAFEDEDDDEPSPAEVELILNRIDEIMNKDYKLMKG